jgi:hypothetical protein
MYFEKKDKELMLGLIEDALTILEGEIKVTEAKSIYNSVNNPAEAAKNQEAINEMWTRKSKLTGLRLAINRISIEGKFKVAQFSDADHSGEYNEQHLPEKINEFFETYTLCSPIRTRYSTHYSHLRGREISSALVEYLDFNKEAE